MARFTAYGLVCLEWKYVLVILQQHDSRGTNFTELGSRLFTVDRLFRGVRWNSKWQNTVNEVQNFLHAQINVVLPQFPR